MFGKRIKLFKIFGFEVGIDWSWVILAILITWSLSVGLFPLRYKDLSTQTYWLMGIVGALGLFFSIVFHEMSHSLNEVWLLKEWDTHENLKIHLKSERFRVLRGAMNLLREPYQMRFHNGSHPDGKEGM